MPKESLTVGVCARDTQHLQDLVRGCILRDGPGCDLNHIDVSTITDMAEVFMALDFNGDISRWNTENVTNATSMFERSTFNGDISAWNMGRLKLAKNMFKDSLFSGDISAWAFGKPGPGNMSEAFWSPHFRSDMPLLQTFGFTGKCVVHPSYQGSFRDEYTLGMAQRFLGTLGAMNRYLTQTAPAGLHRLHIEYMLMGGLDKKRPAWCSQALFQQLRLEKEVGLQLGLDMFYVCEGAYENFKRTSTVLVNCDINSSLFEDEGTEAQR